MSAVGADGALLGEGVSTGFAGLGPQCSLGEVTATTITVGAAGALTIAKEITIADDYPSVDSTCTTDGARQAAAGKACSQLELASATLVEPL